MIEWFVRNPVAANLLMIGIVLLGFISAKNHIPLETFPAIERDLISINTSYRGATPQSVEDSITSRIEEAIYDLDGIKELVSRSNEGSSSVNAYVTSGFDKRELLNDIKTRVDALNSLPISAEKPVVSMSVFSPAVIYVAVSGDVGAKQLRSFADNVRDDLLATNEITLVEYQGIKKLEITIEISPTTLNNYNITLADVGNAVRQGSIDLSAGNIKTKDGDIIIRADAQAYSERDFAAIPVISNSQGSPVLLGQIANISDGFEDQPLARHFNGKPVIMLRVLRVGDQSALKVSKTVRDYIITKKSTLPDSVQLEYWDDDADYLKQRLSTLLRSGLQGGILVIILLSLFLRPAVGFWVFIGIPVSFLGSFICLALVGASFNIITLFAYILVLGIVVDDAIVTGENIYRRIRLGEDSVTAAIKGTQQIATPVTFGILTTVVAFIPLLTMDAGGFARMASQIPLVVIPVLLISLVESKFVLPTHLSHIKPRNELDNTRSKLARIQLRISRGLELVIENNYKPFLLRCLKNKTITLTVLIAFTIITLSYAALGHVKFTFQPKIASETISISLTMPATTGYETTSRHIEMIESHFKELQEEYRDPVSGISIIRNIYTTIGSAGRAVKSNIGQVRAELLPPQNRHIDIDSKQLSREVRKRIGSIPGVQKLNVRNEIFRTGDPIDIEIKSHNIKQTKQIIELLRTKLKEYPTVFDIQDNINSGKEELNIALKPLAHSLGLSLADVARQVRHAIFGFEAQRIQRDRDELRVMIRYPAEDRSSIEDLYALPIRVNGSEVPLSDIAIITPLQSPTTLYRYNRNSVFNVTADVDKENANMAAIFSDLRHYLAELKTEYSGFDYDFKGESQDQKDSNTELANGMILVLFAIYILLAIPFKSYWQPFIVMSVIPFGAVGAILGHMLIGYNLSIMSVVGLLALLGVIVNDSLVLVDYINQRRQEGMPIFEAVLNSGVTRFRPVILTSLTTFVGLMPILWDSSTQAGFLKPMAISLGFGILFATIITLVIVPINYLLGHAIKYKTISLARGLKTATLNFWNKPDIINRK